MRNRASNADVHMLMVYQERVIKAQADQLRGIKQQLKKQDLRIKALEKQSKLIADFAEVPII